MNEENYCVDTQTIVYFAKGLYPHLSYWMTEKKPFVTDVSEKEAIEAFKDHIAHKERNGALAAEINLKKGELAFLEIFVAEAKLEGRFIDTTKDPEIQKRANELNENGITPSVRKNDCIIAANCERHNLILITADKDLKDKLTNENKINYGKFKLAYYPFIHLEQTFQQWLQA